MTAVQKVAGQMQAFRNILVVCDDHSACEHAFARAAWLAQAQGAAVTLVDVVEAAPGELSRLFRTRSGTDAEGVEEAVIALHRDRLEALAETLRQQQIRVTTLVLMGTPSLEIIRQVLRAGHDLVLKGARRSRARPFLADPDIQLLRKCACPVWVLNTQSEGRSRRILAAVDPDPEDETRNRLNWEILTMATLLARQDKAWLDVLNAWRLPEESALRHGIGRISAAEVDALVADTQRQSEWRLNGLAGSFAGRCDRMRVLHVKGLPSDVILDHVETDGIDTVVIGTMARDGVAGFLVGNTAEAILKRVGCSVLTVKPRDFVSPVGLGAESPASGARMQ